MKNTQNIASLIAQLEYEVGKECYNPNSYDGYTGIEGLGYRYPVKVYQNENMIIYRGSIASISPSEIHTMKYVLIHFQKLKMHKVYDMTHNLLHDILFRYHPIQNYLQLAQMG